VRPYELLVMSTMLYSAELWHLKEKVGSSTSQISATDIGHLLERQSPKWGSQDNTAESEAYIRKRRLENGDVLQIDDGRVPCSRK